MRTLLAVLGALWLSALSASPGEGDIATPPPTHISGEMAMSPDGAFVAFTQLGMPASQFVLVETATRHATLVQAPVDHSHIGDLAWSPDSDELTFVTGTQYVLSGSADHVWRLHFSGGAPSIVLLAVIQNVRQPVLSADGATLALFEAVAAGDEPYQSSRGEAFALFERSTSSGIATRRSEGYSAHMGGLLYDLRGALFIAGLQPQFRRSITVRDRTLHSWVETDAAGRSGYRWRDELAASFRVMPGESLELWPVAFPRNAPGGTLVRPMRDGRVILYGSLDSPEVQARHAREWYDERGRPRRPTTRLNYGYFAVAPDGGTELLATADLPDGAGRTGGADVSDDGRHFAQVISSHLPRGVRPANEPRDARDMFSFYDRGVLVFQQRVAIIIERAPLVQAALGEQPIIPVTSTTPRRYSDAS